MDTALVFTWTGPVVGRETKVLDLWLESKEFFGKLAADGKCSDFEGFFSPSAPFHFAMVRGPVVSILDMINSETFRTLAHKAAYVLDDFHYYTYATGEETQEFIDKFTTVGTELGYI